MTNIMNEIELCFVFGGDLQSDMGSGHRLRLAAHQRAREQMNLAAISHCRLDKPLTTKRLTVSVVRRAAALFQSRHYMLGVGAELRRGTQKSQPYQGQWIETDQPVECTLVKETGDDEGTRWQQVVRRHLQAAFPTNSRHLANPSIVAVHPGPLWRVSVIIQSSSQFTVCICYNHGIGDGTSSLVFVHGFTKALQEVLLGSAVGAVAKGKGKKKNKEAASLPRPPVPPPGVTDALFGRPSRKSFMQRVVRPTLGRMLGGHVSLLFTPDIDVTAELKQSPGVSEMVYSPGPLDRDRVRAVFQVAKQEHGVKPQALMFAVQSFLTASYVISRNPGKKSVPCDLNMPVALRSDQRVAPGNPHCQPTDIRLTISFIMLGKQKVKLDTEFWSLARTFQQAIDKGLSNPKNLVDSFALYGPMMLSMLRKERPETLLMGGFEAINIGRSPFTEQPTDLVHVDHAHFAQNGFPRMMPALGAVWPECAPNGAMTMNMEYNAAMFPEPSDAQAMLDAFSETLLNASTITTLQDFIPSLTFPMVPKPK